MTGIKAIPEQWRAVLPALAVVVGGLVLCYWQTAFSITKIWWRSGTYAHGFLIIPISAWLIWQKRHVLGGMTPRPAISMYWVIGALGALWLLARSIDVLIIQQLCLVSMLIAATIAVLGWRVARAISFPLAFLFLAVPMGDDLIPPMMHFTAAFTVKALQLTGIPVLWEGTYITLPNGKWEVAAACSGVRYLIASVTLGLLYAYLIYTSYKRRIIFTLISIALPVIANGIRAYMIVMIGYLSGMKLAVGVDHIIYGWVFFGLVIGVLFFIGSFWREDLVAAAVPVAAPGGADPMPIQVKKIFIAALGVVGLGLVWPLLAMRVDDSNMVIHHVRLDVPVDHAAWRGTAPRWEWQPSYLNPQGQFHQTYAGPGGPVALYIEYYRDQKQGAELIDSENVLVPEKYKKWRYLGDVHTAIKLKGKTVRVLQANIDSADVKLLVWQWYWIGGRVVINPYEAKILEAVAKLFGRSTQSAAIIIAADYDFSPDEARPRLARFVTDMYPSIEKAFANEGLQSDIIGSRN